MAFNKPSQLTGELETLWNDLRNQAGNNPEATITVTDATKFEGIEALSAVGGCSYQQVGDKMEVNLFFDPDTETETAEVTAVAKPHKFATFDRPTQLSGDLATLWDELRAQAGNNPESVIKVTDVSKYAEIDSLAAVGGCTTVKVADGMEVTLFFAPEAAPVEPEVTSVAKPHKFAKD
jgi:hypothetical protein